MHTIKQLLENKTLNVKKAVRKRNVDWEEADELAKRMKVKTPFVMRMFKRFGKDRVKAQLSYMGDLPLTSNRYAALVFNLSRRSA